MKAQARLTTAGGTLLALASAGVVVLLGGCTLVTDVGGQSHARANPTSKSQQVVSTGTALPTLDVSSKAAELSYLNPTTFAAQPAAAVGSLYHSKITNPICTATVLDTPAGNIAITAAHCVTGTGNDLVFRPGSSKNPTPDGSDESPHGTWRVTSVYASQTWLTGQEGSDDVAVLALSPVPGFHPTTSVQKLTGGHTIWQRDLPNRRSSIIGYPADAAGKPVQCNARIVEHNDLPALKCLGTSRALAGAPWFDLTDTTRPRRIMGITGGHQRGGCDVNYAYTPTLGDNVVQLIARALRGEPGDTLPSTPNSPCPAN